jgi:hypothetical protein
MTRPYRDLLDRLNRLTLYIFAAAGIVAAIAGAFTTVSWIKGNLLSIVLFEVSALLAYLVVEFGSMSDRLERIGSHSGEFRAYDTPESLYRAATAALRETAEKHSNKSVWIVSATGIPNARPPRLDTETRDYYRALALVINRAGWSVRILYNVESLDRLEWIHDYLAKMHNAPDLEARAMVRATREILAPLIIGDNHVLLAQGDRRFHAVRAGIWMKDTSTNLLVRNYFDSLWQARDLRVIRNATGIDKSEFESIRQEILSSKPLGKP